MACCEDARLAQRSSRALAALCGFGDEAAMAGIREVPPIGVLSHPKRRREAHIVSVTQKPVGYCISESRYHTSGGLESDVLWQ